MQLGHTPNIQYTKVNIFPKQAYTMYRKLRSILKVSGDEFPSSKRLFSLCMAISSVASRTLRSF